MDVNRYAILIIIKKDWVLELDKNFMDLFGFERNALKKDIIDLAKHRIWIKLNFKKYIVIL